ncbi:hypothetical protein RCH22_000997 [Cryobacterium psychrotolerans]|nr:hypothetical protein [Cryobacterium psychrotolerans]MEC5149277.1 hypothetical protein [Cryobacterium psychrotolerans]MEC5149356.1 hypothetical protein [Cryobacterium psychrotolerans]
MTAIWKVARVLAVVWTVLILGAIVAVVWRAAS